MGMIFQPMWKKIGHRQFGGVCLLVSTVVVRRAEKNAVHIYQNVQHKQKSIGSANKGRKKEREKKEEKKHSQQQGIE
jgi:hypothetical protein